MWTPARLEVLQAGGRTTTVKNSNSDSEDMCWIISDHWKADAREARGRKTAIALAIFVMILELKLCMWS